MNWTGIAEMVIGDVLAACIKSGATKEETAKAIDAAYPFGERAYWPYKAWLSVRKAVFSKLGMPQKGRKTVNAKNDLVSLAEDLQRGGIGE